MTEAARVGLHNETTCVLDLESDRDSVAAVDAGNGNPSPPSYDSSTVGTVAVVVAVAPANGGESRRRCRRSLQTYAVTAVMMRGRRRPASAAGVGIRTCVGEE